MTDTWNLDNKPEQEETPVTAPATEPSTSAEEPAASAEASTASAAEEAAPEAVEPAATAARPAEAEQPAYRPPYQQPPYPQSPYQRPAYQQPPVNGWSSDGGYRYVPPRAGQTPVPPHPVQPTGYPQQPAYGRYTPTGNTVPVPPASAQVPPAYGYGAVPPAATPTGQKPPRKTKGWVIAVAVIATVALLGCAIFGIYMGVSNWDLPDVENSTPTSSNDGGSSPDGLENAPSLGITAWDNDDGGLATKEIVKRNYDSTVLLTSYVRSNDYYYFGQSDLVEAGASTGIVMTADGYIITNRHCVINESTGKAYDQIDVTMYSGEVYENAQVVGADEATDLAVIRIEATGLTPAQFGDSAELEVGDRVVALGNAAGLEWSASEGIVSALARDVYEDTGYAIRCLQVDASINPGNSGGPLLNNQGLVVGINSAKISATDYEGIGFTIPINEAKTIVDSLIKYGYVKGRVALGIMGQTISTGVYNGFMITEIQSGSSLNDTKVQVGDLIVEVDGVTVTDYGTLRAELAKHSVGDTVTLKLLHSDRRTGKVTSYTVSVKLQEQTNG